MIDLARVLTVDDGFDDAKASVEVLETFKGSLKVGSKVTVPAGGGGDCTFPFEARKTYVMYAWEKPSSVGLCSRTREITSISGDTELKWLRTGVLPPLPTVLLRETVSCKPCTLETATISLVGLPKGNDCNIPLRGEEVVPAFDALGTFWAAGYYDSNDDGRRKAVGRGLNGRTFELMQTPYHGTQQSCRQRVVMRWCESLEPLTAHYAQRDR